MPIPILGAAAAALSQGINAFATGRTNRATRKWNEKMYSKQRAHSLEDWQRENDYNSPISQMQRLKDAGLNPQLIYEGNANVASAKVGQSDTGNYRPETPQFDLGGAVAQYQNMKVQQAQTDNLRVQNTVLEQDAKLKKAQELETNSRTANNTFDIGLKEALRESNIEAARLNNERMHQETSNAYERNQREAIMQESNLQEAAVRMSQMESGMKVNEQQIKNLKATEKFQMLENTLAEKGIYKTDPIYWRLAARGIEAITGHQPSQATKSRTEYGQQWFKNLLRKLEGK